jgi:hypothetical protein
MNPIEIEKDIRALEATGVACKGNPSLSSSDLLCAGWRFTRHAILRFRSRARGVGCKQSEETIRNKMVEMLQTKKSLGGDRYYTRGLVWVIEGNLVITVMKPTEERLQAKIWKAHND